MPKDQDKNKDNNINSREVFSFPCEFPIKIVSKANFELENFVQEVIHKYVPNMEHIPVNINTSSKGKYIAATVTITAQSKEQLDQIYQELSANPAVIMVL